MNKIELNQALDFLYQPDRDIQIIIYALSKGDDNLKKLDIESDDLNPIRDMFLQHIRSQIIEKVDYSILPLSNADERGKCYYEYDLELPVELAVLQQVIGNDNTPNFNFKDSDIPQIEALIIVIGDGELQVSLYKRITPVEIVGRGGNFIFKKSERFERFDRNLLRISPGFQIIYVSNTYVVLNLLALEKSFGFEDVIKREALKGIEAIRAISILENIETLEELSDDISFARKLTRISRDSPVILKGIPNSEIISFSKNHPAIKGKIKISDNGNLLFLDTRVSKDLFVKLLNDDFLTSELTKIYYDSLAKDGVPVE